MFAGFPGSAGAAATAPPVTHSLGRGPQAMDHTPKMQGEVRPVNPTVIPTTASLVLVAERATGRYRPPEAVRAERLAGQAEAYFRLRRAVARKGERGRARRGSATEALRSALGALAFSVRTRARSLAVPVRVVSDNDEHQRHLWGLVGAHARLGDRLAFDAGDDGALRVVRGAHELGVLLPVDAAWASVLLGFGATPYVGRVIGDDATWRLSLVVVVGHVGAAVEARRQALGLRRLA